MSNTHPKSELEEFDEMQRKMIFEATEAGIDPEEALQNVKRATRKQYMEILGRMNSGLKKVA